MRIQSSTYVFASESLAAGRVPFGMRLNGQPVVDAVQLFRAAYATVYSRGLGPTDLSFSVWRFFSTEAAALNFFLTHHSSVGLDHDVVLVDTDDSVALTMADAVLTVQVAQRIGVAVLVQYTFTGPRFESSDVPDYPTDTATVKAINQALTIATVEQAITFDVPFATAPRGITLQLSAPDGGGIFGWQIRESTRTAAGFTVDFDAAVPATGYKLTGLAVL